MWTVMYRKLVLIPDLKSSMAANGQLGGLSEVLLIASVVVPEPSVHGIGSRDSFSLGLEWPENDNRIPLICHTR